MEGGKGEEAMTTMSPIMRGDVCCGFILRRGRGRIEGYDAYCNPVGFSKTTRRRQRRCSPLRKPMPDAMMARETEATTGGSEMTDDAELKEKIEQELRRQFEARIEDMVDAALDRERDGAVEGFIER
jgi:hypothetical protein